MGIGWFLLLCMVLVGLRGRVDLDGGHDVNPGVCEPVERILLIVGPDTPTACSLLLMPLTSLN